VNVKTAGKGGGSLYLRKERRALWEERGEVDFFPKKKERSYS